MEQKKIIWPLFGFVIVSSLIDGYLTITYSNGLEDIIARDQNDQLVSLLKIGFPYWSSIVILTLFTTSLLLIVYHLVLRLNLASTNTFCTILVLVGINSILGGLMWPFQSEIIKILNYWVYFVILFICIIILLKGITSGIFKR